MRNCSPEPAKPFEPRPHEIAAPDHWLYVSKRCVLQWLPNVPLWSGLVVNVGPVPFFRVTPSVVTWLEVAGASLEADFLAGRRDRDQLDKYLDAMWVIWRFVSENLDASALKLARTQPPVLPDVELPLELRSNS